MARTSDPLTIPRKMRPSQACPPVTGVPTTNAPVSSPSAPAAAPAWRQVKPQTAMDVNELDPIADFVTISAGQEDDHGIFAYVFAA